MNGGFGNKGPAVLNGRVGRFADVRLAYALTRKADVSSKGDQ